MKAFVSETKIRDLWYTPYMLVLSGHFHTFFYCIVEAFNKFGYDLKYEREVFKLSDNGTIALRWVIDHEGGAPRKLS